MVDQIHTRMTAQDYLDLPVRNTPMQLLDGEVTMSPSPIPAHQEIVFETATVLRAIAKKIGGKVYISPMDVRLDDLNIPQPDVMWLAPESRCQVLEKYLSGTPELIVEVLSPATKRDDKTTKFRLYQRHEVYEYWMIEPQGQLIEVYILQEGRFNLLGIYTIDEQFTSPTLNNATITVKDLFGE